MICTQCKQDKIDKIHFTYGGFCSRSCATSYMNKHIKIKPRESRKCLMCNGTFQVRQFSNRKYCSLACSHEGQIGKSTWNSGKTKENDNRVKRQSEKLKKTYTERGGIISSGFSGKIHSEESRRLISKKLSETIRGRFDHLYHLIRCKVCGKEIKRKVAQNEGFCGNLCKWKYQKTDLARSEKQQLLWANKQWKQETSNKIHSAIRAKINSMTEEEYQTFVQGRRDRNIKHWESLPNEIKQQRSKQWANEGRVFWASRTEEGLPGTNKPNHLEIKFLDFLESISLGSWRYVGDGQRWIAGKCPDFIHRQDKKIIELFGCYWHNCPECRGGGFDFSPELDRILHFDKYGYKCLIIWAHELKYLERVKSRVLEFMGV